MAPIDFEKELKEKLRSREVRPSEKAWERISARLEEVGPLKRRSNKPWLALAAACAALLLGFMWMWEAPREPITDPVVVSPREEQVSEPEISSQPDAFEELDSSGESHLADVETAAPEEDMTSAKENIPPGEYPVISETQTDLAVAEIVDEVIITEDMANPVKALPTEETVREEAQGVSQAEIDLLLQRAQEALALQNERDTISAVDPMALLNKAEDELDQTFRDQILEKLKTGINKVRTSVADRNK